MEIKVYLLTYGFRRGYEGRGNEVWGCFKARYHAELATYWLNDIRSHYNIPHEEFDVEEIQVV